MKLFFRNISFIALLAVIMAACTEAEPEYTDFPSKDVDFTYSVAPNSNGELEYALDYYVVSTIQFNNKSAKSGNVTWDFGDGTTSNEQNPVHKYAKAGNYTVKLTIDGVGSRTYPIMIYDIAPVLSIKSQSADLITINDVSVDFNIFLPNPENKKVKYEWTFPDGTIDEAGNPITSFVGYADETGKVDYPGKLKFKNIGSQRISLKATFDLDGENRTLAESFVNVQVGADKEYKTLYYAVVDGNIKALKLIPDAELPKGSKNLPFDMGVKAGNMPFTLAFAEVENTGWVYILDAGRQYTYINDEAGTQGDGKINVMSADGSLTNVMVTNVGQAAFNDPFFGMVDGEDLLYSDRNTGVRRLALKTRGAKETNNYFVQNNQLGYYNKAYSYGAISTTLYKNSKDLYYWGKNYGGAGIYRFMVKDIVTDYASAASPYQVILPGINFKGFTIDEKRGALYVWRTKTEGGFYEYKLPADNVGLAGGDFEKRVLMDADPLNTSESEGVYCTQLVIDSETGLVYFGFNKESKDSSTHPTGLKYYDPAKGAVVDIPAVTDKILGVTINDKKSKLF